MLGKMILCGKYIVRGMRAYTVDVSTVVHVGAKRSPTFVRNGRPRRGDPTNSVDYFLCIQFFQCMILHYG